MKRKKNKKKKSLENIPSKISEEKLNEILFCNQKREVKSINDTDPFKLHKKYSAEIKNFIKINFNDKEDPFLYFKTHIKIILEELINIHDFIIDNNQIFDDTKSNQWILDKQSLIIALKLIKDVSVSKNDFDK